MAQTTAEAVLRALEPSVERLLERHLTSVRDWYPHQFVPWSAAQDFDGPLNGAAWKPQQSTLPQAVQDALVINLLTEDNLPSYHFELANRLGRDGAWGTWIHRWTAEEGRHADALRAFIHARRVVDPVTLEQLRMRHVGAGYSSDLPTLLHTLAYVTVQELATRQAHRNAGAACGDRVGEQLMGRIAADENLHMLFYRGLYADAAQAYPDEAMVALADVICDFRMPGTAIPGFKARALRVAASGIFNLDVHHDHVVLPLLKALGVMSRPGLSTAGQQAQERIGLYVDQLAARASRARQLYERLNASRDTTV